HGGIGGRGVFGFCVGRRRSVRRRRRADDETVALQRAVDLGEIGGLITRRWHDKRVAARDRAGDIARVEARQLIARQLRLRGADRTAEAVGGELHIGGGGGNALLPALGSTRLAGQE